MELDDFKAAWQELNERIETDISLHRRTIKEVKLNQTRLILSRFMGLPIFELISGVIAVFITGSFLASSPHTVRFIVPGVILHVAVILTIAVSIWQIAVLANIDYTAPVLEIQRRIARLRAVRLRFNGYILLFSPLLWPPLAIVAAQGLLGLDLYRVFGPLWIITNCLFGLFFVWVVPYLSRRYSGLLSRSRLISYFASDLAGRGLASAMQSLEEIALFDQE